MNFSTSLQTEKLSMGDFFFFFFKLLMPMFVAVGECVNLQFYCQYLIFLSRRELRT